MKKLIFLTALVISCSIVGAQGVGIGTSSPNPNAILDLTSTNKGLLVPRLTSSQRSALADMGGMIVFDSTLKRMYYGTGSGWQYLVDNSYWSLNGSTSAVYNLSQVGIGTVTPHASARLHVNSTTQGFLPPSVTSTQRININTPADGLMVYDNTVDRLYQYQAGSWKTMLNNDYWAMSGSNLYNTTANVAIGNANPLERLHVEGNIRADGDLISYGEVRINNVEGILQFQNGATDKTFVQISGENLRMGTNGGNTLGNVVFRLNGADKIFIQPDGDLNLLGGGDIELTSAAKLIRGSSGSVDILPIAYGRISSAGTLLSGTTNVTSARVSEGLYQLHCPDFTSTTTIIITMNTYVGGFYAYPNVEHWPSTGPNFYRVPFYNISAGAYRDAGFSFVAYR
jgi:hypothetical protein